VIQSVPRVTAFSQDCWWRRCVGRSGKQARLIDKAFPRPRTWSAARSASAGFRFPAEVIVVAVRSPSRMLALASPWSTPPTDWVVRSAEPVQHHRREVTGGYTVEPAGRAGLHVVAVAGDRDEDLVREYGAEHFISRTQLLPSAMRDSGAWRRRRCHRRGIHRHHRSGRRSWRRRFRRGARRDAAAIGSIRVSNIWRLFEVEPGLCCDGGPSTGLDEVIRRGLRPLTGGPSASVI
jgi:hypothetical protein